MMCEEGPPWLNINDWQQSVHQADAGIIWTKKMDAEVRRYMDGKVQSATAGVNIDQPAHRVEGRGMVLMIEARGGVG